MNNAFGQTINMQALCVKGVFVAPQQFVIFMLKARKVPKESFEKCKAAKSYGDGYFCFETHLKMAFVGKAWNIQWQQEQLSHN